MRFNQAVEIALALFTNRLFRKRTPLFAAWNITFRCNLSCKYCGAGHISIPELGTRDVLERLDQLWALGVRWITFGGGEPLLREDIGTVLGYAKQKGFHVYLSTNGSLAARRTEDLKGVDHVNLSLDGNREIHDRIRGRGAFDSSMASIEVFRGLGISTSLLCVLSKHNLDQVREVIGFAAKYGLLVMFQPATLCLNISREQNPVCPPVEDYRRTIALLVDLKKKGAPIRNSVTGLKHLAQWPWPSSIWCPAGQLMLVLEPNGVMNACRPETVNALGGDRLHKTGSIQEQFMNLNVSGSCNECWCAPVVELSLALSLKPEAVWNAWRLFR